MLAAGIRSAWNNKPKLSRVFWLSAAIFYIVGVVAIFALANPTVNAFLEAANAPKLVALKLNYIRLPIVCLSLIVFPFLLWTSLTRTLIFLRLVTAALVIVYIDDHLVLYKIIEYPNLPIFQFALFLRPFAIMAMFWMTFEVHYRLKYGEQT